MHPKLQHTIDQLKAGRPVVSKEPGNSMVPLIYSRQPVTLESPDPDKLTIGDIVYVKVRGRVYTHKIVARRGNLVQIGNNRGGINGWTKIENVFGLVTEIDGVPVSGAHDKVRLPK